MQCLPGYDNARLSLYPSMVGHHDGLAHSGVTARPMYLRKCHVISSNQPKCRKPLKLDGLNRRVKTGYRGPHSLFTCKVTYRQQYACPRDGASSKGTLFFASFDLPSKASGIRCNIGSRFQEPKLKQEQLGAFVREPDEGLTLAAQTAWLFRRTGCSSRPRLAKASLSAGGEFTSSETSTSSGEAHRPNRLSFLKALVEPIEPVIPTNPDPTLINEDFKPTMPDKRIFTVWDLTSLWIGLVVGVPTWYLAGSLVELGMSWWQGVLTVFTANCLVLLPMVLNGHPGCKYGIPFPVLSRASFGIKGANVPSLLRALVACGWFGIQTWVGGQAICQLANTLTDGALVAPVVNWLGISYPELGCFLAFWSLQVAIIWNGIESIRDLEAYSAPVLIVMCAALLGWAYVKAGSFGEMLSTPSQFRIGGPKEGLFWATFFPALTANVGFWATLSLNIPDFTRYAKSQEDQLAGQAIGLPLFMAAFTFVGLAVTSATVVIFGRVISDPIEVLSQVKGLGPVLLSLVGLMLATLSTNIAANVVAPANALINLKPDVFSFRNGGLVTALLGILLAPWRLVQSTQGFIFTWLIGYSALLGPVGGIVITDYFILRRRKLHVDSLYSSTPSDPYWYSNGYNPAALLAMTAGILPNIPGFLVAAGIVQSVPQIWVTIYGSAWLVGFVLASVVYGVLMALQGSLEQLRDLSTTAKPNPEEGGIPFQST